MEVTMKLIGKTDQLFLGYNKRAIDSTVNRISTKIDRKTFSQNN